MNSSSKKFCIFGTGGAARDAMCCLVDELKSKKLNFKNQLCFIEQDASFTNSQLMGFAVLKQSEFNPSLHKAFISMGNPLVRQKVVQSLPNSTEYFSIIHPSVIMSEWVKLGEGCLLSAGVILTCNINIGKHSHLNLQSTITHDFHSGDYFTTAPAVNISGNCTVGDRVYFGTNSAMKQGVQVCDDVTIGMGAIVVKNISKPGIYIGNPAHEQVSLTTANS